ncbi:hypothetical protein [Halapricum desulfuricans]|uniref:Putative membrane protein n=1 Tax=Halapricum desulfuricans TaxID=2841257 RepID=A0A897MZQ9_9EURY|nr:hypothetical protein [Halapricum desulfuricans]QSG04369.1 putative membrane protein [Halapricum desulfuricans]QSG07432.1 putative membrane protein [Halapricum desulfuricans]QSG10454.1 putative membrane protein [Halapricum desulfuricans]
MATDTRKLAVGGGLLSVSSVVIIALGVADLPVVVGAVAALGLAAGALLVGTSEGGRPV